ncbi:hypothetical protein V6N13_129889 [Hibiscus sabdariffa]|uniref:Uncharacterized protein n=1 Tax=Hibiscus sabdariffa TaxID=183260 RepID=A0ABR2SML1_9ROSI
MNKTDSVSLKQIIRQFSIHCSTQRPCRAPYIGLILVNQKPHRLCSLHLLCSVSPRPLHLLCASPVFGRTPSAVRTKTPPWHTPPTKTLSLRSVTRAPERPTPSTDLETLFPADCAQPAFSSHTPCSVSVV